MITWLKDLKVGDEVYVVPSKRAVHPYLAVVVKIGRKLVHFAILCNGKKGPEFSAYIEQFGGVTQVKSEYSSALYIYRSQQEYAEWQALNRLRGHIAERIRGAGTRYPELTAEQAEAIGKILNEGEA